MRSTAVVAKITKKRRQGRGDRARCQQTPTTSTKAAEQILAKHGRIDLLVNSAGINVPKRSWADMELEGWDKLVEINLNGVLYCMRAVLPAMRKQKDGCIINVASWAGRHVSKMPGPAYTTTKHAVLALTHSFNMDECVNGLRACCLSPGEVATPILKLRPVVPSEAEQAKMLQPEDLRPHHRLRRLHAAAGLHQRDPDQPDAQSRLYPDAEQPDYVAVAVELRTSPAWRGGRCARSARRWGTTGQHFNDMRLIVGAGRLFAGGDIAEVVSGRKTSPGAAQHHRASRTVGDVLHMGFERPEDIEVQRVELVRAVQRQMSDAVAVIPQH